MRSTTLYDCKNCGAAFLSVRYRSCCPDCGGEPQWILLCVLAVVFGLLLGLKTLGHAHEDDYRPARIDQEDGEPLFAAEPGVSILSNCIIYKDGRPSVMLGLSKEDLLTEPAGAYALPFLRDWDHPKMQHSGRDLWAPKIFAPRAPWCARGRRSRSRDVGGPLHSRRGHSPTMVDALYATVEALGAEESR